MSTCESGEEVTSTNAADICDTVTLDLENRTRSIDFAVWVSLGRQPHGKCYAPSETNLGSGVIVTAGTPGYKITVPTLSTTTAETVAQAGFPLASAVAGKVQFVTVTYVALASTHSGANNALVTSDDDVLTGADWSSMGGYMLTLNLCGGGKTISGKGENSHIHSGFHTEILGDARPPSSGDKTHSLALRFTQFSNSPAPAQSQYGNISAGHKKCITSGTTAAVVALACLCAILLGVVGWLWHLDGHHFMGVKFPTQGDRNRIKAKEAYALAQGDGTASLRLHTGV